MEWRMPSLVVAAALVVSLLPLSASGICPGQCRCDEDALRTECQRGNLSVVPIFLNPEIKHLEMSGNQIRKLEGALGFYPKLETVDLSVNSLQHLGKSQFASLRGLQALNLSHNLITTLHNGGFHGPRQSLQTLDLSHNALGSVEAGAFRGLDSLVDLWLGDNLIEAIAPTAFQGLGRLRLLHLERNRLAEVASDWMPPLHNLRFLYASENRVRELRADAFRGLSALQVLELRDNEMRSVEDAAFRGCRTVDTLDLSGNSLDAVPSAALSRLPSLHHLDLSANPVSEIADSAFAALYDLRSLRLERLGRLTSVAGHAFLDAAKLRSLSLSRCPRLQPLPWGVFETNVMLESVDFSGNSWKTLSPMQIPRHSALKELHLGGLPLHCNCSVTWLWELYRRAGNASEDGHGIKLDPVHCASVASGVSEAPDSEGRSPAGGEAGDPLSQMALSQLSCEPHASTQVLMVVSASVLATVLLLVCVALAAYRWRRWRAGVRRYGGAACLHIKDDTMVYKGALAQQNSTLPILTAQSSYLSHAGLHLQSSNASCASETAGGGAAYSPASNCGEPFYEVPRYDDEKGARSDDGGGDRGDRYYVGSELWESSGGHCYTNQLPAPGSPYLHKSLQQHSSSPLHGSSNSNASASTNTTTTAFGSGSGSGSLSSGSNSSTASSSNKRSKQLHQFFSPPPSRQQLQHTGSGGAGSAAQQPYKFGGTYYSSGSQQQQQHQPYFSPQLASKTLMLQQMQRDKKVQPETPTSAKDKKAAAAAATTMTAGGRKQLHRAPGNPYHGPGGTLNLYV